MKTRWRLKLEMIRAVLRGRPIMYRMRFAMVDGKPFVYAPAHSGACLFENEIDNGYAWYDFPNDRGGFVLGHKGGPP